METVVVFVVLPHVQEDDSDYIILLMSGGRLLGEVFVSHLVAAAVARFLENDSDIVREDLLQEVQDETGHVCGEVHLSEWTRLGESPTIPGMQIIRFTLEGDVFSRGGMQTGPGLSQPQMLTKSADCPTAPKVRRRRGDNH